MNEVSAEPRRIGIYLHSPFCVHKCSYCDFNSWAETRREPQDLWFGALQKQVAYWSTRSAGRVVVDTVFWGGGTPSLLANELIVRTGELLTDSFDFAPDCEFTIEANPETITEDKIAALAQSGANRLSVGIQSFKNSSLDRLERHARSEDNHRALQLLSKYWQGRWSLDMIFGLPDQSIEEWREDLDTALSYSPSHISAYQLTLSTARAKTWKQANDEVLLAFFNETQERLAAAGLDRYEVSNFAKKGQESRHNLGYWELKPFIGFGPGAAGLLSGAILGVENRFGVHQKQFDAFEKWQANAGAADYETRILEPRSARDHSEELLMMGLRLKKGIEAARLGPASRKALGRLQAQGFIEENNGRVFCTEAGYRILDSLLIQLFKIIDEDWVQELDSAQSDPSFR